MAKIRARQGLKKFDITTKQQSEFNGRARRESTKSLIPRDRAQTWLLKGKFRFLLKIYKKQQKNAETTNETKINSLFFAFNAVILFSFSLHLSDKIQTIDH